MNAALRIAYLYHDGDVITAPKCGSTSERAPRPNAAGFTQNRQCAVPDRSSWKPALACSEQLVSVHRLSAGHFPGIGTRSRCGSISPEVSCEREIVFFVCRYFDCSRYSARTGEAGSAGRSTRKSDYRKRKGDLLVCRRRCDPCG